MHLLFHPRQAFRCCPFVTLQSQPPGAIIKSTRERALAQLALAVLALAQLWNAHTVAGKQAFNPIIADPAVVLFRPPSACCMSPE